MSKVIPELNKLSTWLATSFALLGVIASGFTVLLLRGFGGESAQTAGPQFMQDRGSWILVLIIFGIQVPFFAILGWMLGKRITRLLMIRLADATQSNLESSFQPKEIMTPQEVQEVERLRLFEAGSRVISATLESVTAAIQEAQSSKAVLNLDYTKAATKFVDLIPKALGLSSARLYWLEGDGEWAALQAWNDVPNATGELPGEFSQDDLRNQASSEGHPTKESSEKIRVGEGLVGKCIAENQACLSPTAALRESASGVQDLEGDRLYQTEQGGENPPGSESDSTFQAALPLRTRDRMIGALLLSAKGRQALNRENLPVLQNLADQVAAILENVDLLVQYCEMHEKARSETIHPGLGSGVHDLVPVGSNGRETLPVARSVRGYRADENGVSAISLTETGPSTTEAETAEDQESAGLSLPIRLRGRILGALELHKNAGYGDWTPDELHILNRLADQLSAALESASLYEQTQRRAERERLASQIVGKIRANNHPETILQVAADELRQALRAGRTQVHIQPSLPAEILGQGSNPPQPDGRDLNRGDQ